ncbi:MAG: adenylyltransferase/cytidyltransferase family protein [Candidatus Pacebacteria bacterium]|nr:adenylyltransferase/cytidyltransferase family protein [Candidatus Paceibacterota bacterium]MDD5356688.1 adenylyltransferase/cytidyltransferase family protein [Candidatus Paceibacterota bacterium]
MKNGKKVLVFGTFDGVHEGHRHFLREAKKFGDILIVAVARDEHVETLKKHSPRFSLQKRIADLGAEKIADYVIEADETLGTWNVILKNKPDVVALGYDQDGLGNALENAKGKFPFPIEILKISSHKPDIFRSGLLNR